MHLNVFHSLRPSGITDLSFSLAYMKKVTEAMKKRGADEAAIKEFQTAAQKYSAKILSNWDNYDTYTGASQDPDGMYVGNPVSSRPVYTGVALLKALPE